MRYWLHNEFLQLGAMKMAKSAGGAPRLADLTEAGYHPLAYRLFLLGGHYRSQLDFTTAAMDAAQATLRRLVARVQPLRPLPAAETLAAAAREAVQGTTARRDSGRYLDTIDAAIAADLSTPKILAALQDALRDPAITPDGLRTIVAAADALLGLGLATLDPGDLERRRCRRATCPPRSDAPSSELVADRTQARRGARLGPGRPDPRLSSTSSASRSPTPQKAPSGSSAKQKANAQHDGQLPPASRG